MKECTFSPRIYTQNKGGHRKSPSNMDIPMEQRINIYNEKKKSKIDSMKHQLEEAKYQECKFRPEIVI